MCASIENYAKDTALDMSITTCIAANLSKEAIAKAVKISFPEYGDERINSRVTLLWNQKNK